MRLGVFKESADAYHAEEHLGSTSVKEMRKSPAHFYEAWKGPKKESAAFDEGTAVHSAILEQDISGFIARPAGIDGRTKDGKAALAELEATGKIILPADVFASLERRLDSFVKSTEAMRRYNGAKVEESYYVQDHDSGLFIKARPDIFKPGSITDFKTTSDMGKFQNQVWSLAYHIQIGFYALVTEQVTGVPTREASFIAQEKSAPFGTRVFRLPITEIETAKAEARALLNRCAVAIRENSFPSYDDVLTDLIAPKWLLNEDAFSEVG